jgi:hypothetical protein
MGWGLGGYHTTETPGNANAAVSTSGINVNDLEEKQIPPPMVEQDKQ